MNTKKITRFMLAIVGLVVLSFVLCPLALFAAESSGGSGATVASQSIWTALIPVIVPIVVAGLKLLIPKIPTVWLPILCPIVGMVVDLIAYFAGQQTQGTAMGALLGLAGTGVREIYDQLRKQLSGSALSVLIAVCLLSGVAVGCSGGGKKKDKSAIAPAGDAPCQVTPANSAK